MLLKAVGEEGREVTGTRLFTAGTESGSVSVDFNFDSRNMGGKKIVVFEYLYENGELIASHEDLDSEDQTVTIKTNIPLIPATGDELPLTIIIGIMLVTLLGALCALKKTR